MGRSGAAIILVLCLALPASGQPEKERRAEARGHFEAGRVHHKLGRFEQAIEEYERAYQLVPLPDLLFNIGQCHRNLKNHERAIFFFQRFLDESPSANDAELVRKLISELEGTLAREKAVVKVESATVTSPELPREEVVAPQKVVEVEEEGIHEKWWFWTILVVGAAAVAGGVYAVTTQTSMPEGSIGTIDLR